MITALLFITEHRESAINKGKIGHCGQKTHKFNRQISILEQGILYPVHMY